MSQKWHEKWEVIKDKQGDKDDIFLMSPFIAMSKEVDDFPYLAVIKLPIDNLFEENPTFSMELFESEKVYNCESYFDLLDLNLNPIEIDEFLGKFLSFEIGHLTYYMGAILESNKYLFNSGFLDFITSNINLFDNLDSIVINSKYNGYINMARGELSTVNFIDKLSILIQHSQTI